ncbi:hypothetical protein ACFW1M_39245 [Streptomyces inhibens]|uniref:hypothetical protein n=1 Tax=Streptomyces inhibens TaxID=2293571 RepID=UPI0036BF83FA
MIAATDSSQRATVWSPSTVRTTDAADSSHVRTKGVARSPGTGSGNVAAYCTPPLRVT